jgi:Cu/Ag efflux pump CusA
LCLVNPSLTTDWLACLWWRQLDTELGRVNRTGWTVRPIRRNSRCSAKYIQQLIAEGMELRPALLLAGRRCFQPILMTSLAAILGLAPPVLGIGPGAQMQQLLAIRVFGGMTANMLFTHMIIPVRYLVMKRRKTQKT